MKFLNVTNHKLTAEQLDDLKGIEVVELPEELKACWGNLTPFNYKSLVKELELYINKEFNASDMIMIAGFMPAVVELVRVLKDREYNVVYSYTKRIVEEKYTDVDTVTKTSVFKHQGFYQY